MSRLRKNEEDIGVMVRIPKKIAENLKEIKEKQQLPSYGNALQFMLKEVADEEIQTRLINLEENFTKVWDSFLFSNCQRLLQNIAVSKFMEGGIKEDFKVNEVDLEHLREAKRTLEEIGKGNTATYKQVCAYIYVNGNFKEDTTPKMKEIFKQFIREVRKYKEEREEERGKHIKT